MAIITIDSATFCHGTGVADRVAERLEYAVLADRSVIEVAAENSGLPPDKLSRIVYGPSPFFGSLTRDPIRAVAALREAMIESISQDNLVYHGLLGHILPKTLNHVLRVCLAGTRDYRLEHAASAGVSAKAAERQIKTDDEARADWIDLLFGCGPWDKHLFDVFVAMQETSVDEAVDLICDSAGRPAVATTTRTNQLLDSARLAARVNTKIAAKGHDVEVVCDGEKATVLTQKYAIFEERQHKELIRLAMSVEGIESVEIGKGHRYKEPGISFNIDMDVPSKVLLVDDETEFVHTLSERLETRSFEPSIAYDGEEALAMVANDQPEVMVLDLKMPGIDGLEVLRRVKKTHPEVEIIILTGHGSAVEEKLANDLGAFAYLRKPVDIEELTKTMKAAYQKVAEHKGSCDHEK